MGIPDAAEQAALCAELKSRIDALFADSRDGPQRAHYEAEGGRRYTYIVISNGWLKPEGVKAHGMGVGHEAKAVEAILAEVKRQFPHHAHQRVVWRRAPTYKTDSSTRRFDEERWIEEDDTPDHDIFHLSVRLCAEEVYDREIPKEDAPAEVTEVVSA